MQLRLLSSDKLYNESQEANFYSQTSIYRYVPDMADFVVLSRDGISTFDSNGCLLSVGFRLLALETTETVKVIRFKEDSL